MIIPVCASPKDAEDESSKNLQQSTLQDLINAFQDHIELPSRDESVYYCRKFLTC
jgi:hypothetical protein